MAGLPHAVRVELDWGVDLGTLIQVWEPYGDDLDDNPDGGGPGGLVRTVTLGELIAERLIGRAGGALEAAVRARIQQITEEEIRDQVRGRIAAVMSATDPAALSDGQLTLAARIEREYARQLTDPRSGGFAHGKDAPVIAAIVQAEVTAAFRDLASGVVGRVRELALAEIAGHARSGADPIPPGG